MPLLALSLMSRLLHGFSLHVHLSKVTLTPHPTFLPSQILYIFHQDLSGELVSSACPSLCTPSPSSQNCPWPHIQCLACLIWSLLPVQSPTNTFPQGSYCLSAIWPATKPTYRPLQCHIQSFHSPKF